MKHIHQIIKSIFVTILATLIAYLLGVTNYLTAGIIAMISIQKTKSLSLNISLKRTILVFISVIVSSLFFVLIGFNLLAYSLFVVFVIILGYSFSLESGIIPSVVVVTHLLVHGSFSISFTFETLLMFLIAIGTALLFNLFYPSESMLELEKYKTVLDETIKKHLLHIKTKLDSKDVSCAYSSDLEKVIEESLKKIEQITGDLIMRNHQDVLNYSTMRSKQFDILKNVCSLSDNISGNYPQTVKIIDYIDQLSKDIGTINKATPQLMQIDELLLQFREDDLPKTRREFEDRAILYHIVLEIKQFLVLKVRYHFNQE